jgi:hypothetical protein
MTAQQRSETHPCNWQRATGRVVKDSWQCGSAAIGSAAVRQCVAVWQGGSVAFASAPQIKSPHAPVGEEDVVVRVEGKPQRKVPRGVRVVTARKGSVAVALVRLRPRGVAFSAHHEKKKEKKRIAVEASVFGRVFF